MGAEVNNLLKTKSFCSILTAIFLLFFLSSSIFGAPLKKGTYVPGEVVIKLKQEVVSNVLEANALTRSNNAAITGIASLDDLAARFGAVRSEPVFRTGEKSRARLSIMLQSSSSASQEFNPALYQKILFPDDVDMVAAIDAYKKDPNVAFAEPNYIRRPVTAPNPGTDPDYGRQWHLDAINARQAWQFLGDKGINPGGSRDVVIAVIDTGVDYAHSDLAGNMWINSGEIPDDGIDNDGNGFVDDVYGANVVAGSGDPNDDHGHGTHVAGITSAQANNGAGGVGVAFNTQIMAIKAAQYSGVLTTADIAEGILYAVDKGADVINMSFGGYFQSQVEEDALAVAFGHAVLVAAAGNDAKNNERICRIPAKAMYPASYPWVLGVMASARSANAKGDWLAGFSNRDVKAENSIEYELMAPGAGIYSTLPGDQYAAWSGTSMSAPVVSGIAALVRSYYSDKDMYSSRFIMGQIAPTGPFLQGYSPPCGSPISYHTADALAALSSVPQPSLTYLEHWLFDEESLGPINDDDGRVDSGETVDLAVTIRNHWGKADNVQVTLRAWNGVSAGDDPFVTLDIPTVDYGAVGSFNIDDNGLIYDGEGEIIGVNHPFRCTVSPDCPNNHVIPFLLTMTCDNGYDPDDSNNPYTFTSRFELVVQRGVELPRFISEDTVLTSDNYYIVSDATLVSEGVTLTIQEGTQIQFWSSDPEDPYSIQPDAKIVVAGTLLARGTAEDPVRLFPSSLHPDRFVVIQGDSDGVIDFQYARVTNPHIEGATVVEHCYFDQDSDVLLFWRTQYEDWLNSFPSKISATSVTFSIFHKLGVKSSIDGFDRQLSAFDLSQTVRNSLFDSGAFLICTDNFSGNVMLKNYKLFREQWGDRLYGLTRIKNWGPAVDSQISLRGVFPRVEGDMTYWLVNAYDIHEYTFSSWLPYYFGQRAKFLFSEEYARQFSGHIISINDETEDTFISTYLSEDRTLSAFDANYPGLNWERYSSSPVIGLIDLDNTGILQWVSGEPVEYTHWNSGEPGTIGEKNALTFTAGSWYYHPSQLHSSPILLEIPGVWTQAEIDAVHEANLLATLKSYSGFKNNAILNCWQDPDPDHWLDVEVSQMSETASSWYTSISGNYWGTQSTTMIDAAIKDFQDDFLRPQIIYEPILTTPPEDCYPFVTDVILSIDGNPNATVVGAEPVTFHVTFNRDMDTSAQPAVSFGPDMPETDYTVHPVDGGWTDPRTWQGTFNITPVTGDGYQFIRVAGAVAADDPWLVTGDDSERFRFEIITSGTESMNLQATGGEGYVDLMWTQDDFDLLAGFNLYRSATADGTFSRINTSIIPPEERTYLDTVVQPGQPYYYKFTIVKSDMTESDYSNTATATPTDTVPPVISHTPVTSAAPGIAVSIYADVTDNVSVEGVTLYYRTIGDAGFQSKVMVNATGDRYSASLEGSLLVSPGVEYYIEATDGISITRHGRPEYPWQIAVQDKPMVTAVSPDHGSSLGGTTVTVSGTNFKAGAGVTFGGAAADNVTLQSENQLTCTAPPHFAEIVDVAVGNPDGQSGILLRAFTYESESASMSLPDAGSGRNSIVQVPLNMANVQGLMAADVTVTFDNAVLHARGASAGNLITGWSLAANTGTAGSILVSAASPGGNVSGSGILANLEFEVVGSPGSNTTLEISQVVLNDGAIPVETATGQFSVDLVYHISGAVNYWNGGAGVQDVLLKADGDRIYTIQSSEDGTFTVSNLPADDYTLTPDKSDGAHGITAYDASLVLQHAVQLTTLTGHAATAGDVNKSGAVNAMDASYILQKAVDLIDLPFPGAGVVWEFDPSSRSYSGLNNDQDNQDFTTVLIGDVNGSWTAAAQAVSLSRTRDTLSTNANETICFSLPDVGGAPGSQVVMALQTTNADAILSADMAVTYPSNKLTAVSVEKVSFSDSMSLAANLTTPGEIRIAMAGATGISGNGDLVKITFQLAGDASQTADVSLSQISINDMVITNCIQDGSITIVEGVCGDVNENERVDIGDAMFIAQYLVGNRDASTLNLDLADVNANTRPDIGDAMFIAQYLVGNRDCLCLGTEMAVCGE